MSSPRRARTSTGRPSCTAPGEMAAIAAPFLTAPPAPGPGQDGSRLAAVLEEAQRTLTALDLIAVFNVRTGSPDRSARSSARTTCWSPRPWGNCPPRTARCTRTTPITPRDLAGVALRLRPFTAVFNISGQPAISLPLAQSASGLPIGVQLVAPTGARTYCFSRRPARTGHALELQTSQHRLPEPAVVLGGVARALDHLLINRSRPKRR